MKARIRGRASAALLVLVVSMIAFGATPGAIASQDQFVTAGETNTENYSTSFADNDYSGPCPFVTNVAVVGCSVVGVAGYGTDTGVGGQGDKRGVYGQGGESGVYGLSYAGNGVEGESNGSNNGVYGHADNAGGSGVYGQNDGTGYGVAGRANSGTGVFGDSQGGIGVRASTEGGTALNASAGAGGTSITTKLPTAAPPCRSPGRRSSAGAASSRSERARPRRQSHSRASTPTA
jgi:hypothetical protein